MEITIPTKLEHLYKQSEIVKYPHPILRQKAKEVEKFDITLYKRCQKLAKLMKKYDGLGLSGPQIGLGIRIMCVGAKIMINPVITSSSGEQINEEGCLSIPNCFARLKRANFVDVSYQNMNGVKCSASFTGLDAVVAQHEISHLNGELFIDICEENSLRWAI